MDSDNRRDDVLNRFKEALKEPLYRRFFDEDELVEVFDYATDEDDAYLQSEALLTGARLFPENEELEKRRAEFYSTLDSETLSNFLADHERYTAAIACEEDLGLTAYWSIMKLQSEHLNADELLQKLDIIITRIQRLFEEDLIQLVKLASEFEETVLWLFENVDRLIKLSGNEELVLHELGVVATENDAPEAVEYFERLTELDPFNSIYWCKKAIAYFKDDSLDEAMTSIEYAQALDPESKEVARVAVEIANQEADDNNLPNNFVETARLAFDMDDPDRRLFNIMLRACTADHKVNEAINLSREYAIHHASDMQLVYDALSYIILNVKPDNLFYELDKFFIGVLGSGTEAKTPFAIGLFMDQAVENEDYGVVVPLFDYLAENQQVLSWMVSLYLKAVVKQEEYGRLVSAINQYGLDGLEGRTHLYYMFLYLLHTPVSDRKSQQYVNAVLSFRNYLERFMENSEEDSEDYIFALGLKQLTKDL